ncbi:hypothetical protein PVAP13_1KG067954 [Panicum virgatum]|uniref:Uncharacterized protein n=1 Tax=Panicum virgatum TaxID=38727 RepID=A0A8T0X7Y1_PANVG|nr:hypothetical protein PVAP13_1KG067954 [Panicum virgatum]
MEIAPTFVLPVWHVGPSVLAFSPPRSGRAPLFASFPFLIRCPGFLPASSLSLAVYTRLSPPQHLPLRARFLHPPLAALPLSADSELGEFGHCAARRRRPLPSTKNPARAPAAPRAPVRACSALALTLRP